MSEAIAFGWAIAYTLMVLEGTFMPGWAARSDARWLARQFGGTPADHLAFAMRHLHEAMPRRILFAAAGWVAFFALRGAA